MKPPPLTLRAFDPLALAQRPERSHGFLFQSLYEAHARNDREALSEAHHNRHHFNVLDSRTHTLSSDRLISNGHVHIEDPIPLPSSVLRYA